MNFLNKSIYTFKQVIFNLSNEKKKIRRPNYNELIKYQNFKKKGSNKLVLSFGAGRSGQNWFSKIFNSHYDWIGTCERFADFEAFYRFVCYYKLPINRDGFLNLVDLASKRDMAIYQNSFISSPYFSLGVSELTKFLKPDYIFFNIRNPIQTVESLHNKGWYKYLGDLKKIKSPSINISDSQYRSFSRIVPNNEFLDKWTSLTRIGKIAWFWAEMNNKILLDFKKLKKVKKYYVKLEDFNQNYFLYEKLFEEFKFKNKLTKEQFLNIINITPNNDTSYLYKYNNWNHKEKKDFEMIINDFFPNYDEIKTNF